MKFKGFMKRHKNRIMCIVSAFVLFCGFVFSSPLKVNAAQVQETGQEFYLHYAQPSTSSNQGYVNILFQRGTTYYVETYFWSMEGLNNEGAITTMKGNVIVDYSSITFTGYGNIGNTFAACTYSLYKFDRYGNCLHLQTSRDSRYYESLGATAIGCMAYGNVELEDYTVKRNFTVYYATDGSSLLLMDVVDLLTWTYNLDVDIYNTAYSILNSVDGLENQLTSVINYLKSVDDKLPDIQDKLNDIYDKLDDILEEEKKQTSWLEKIWNSIQEFFTPDEKDKETTDKLEEQSKEQSSQLDELNKQNQTEKLDPSTSSGSVDANVDTNAITNYGTVLQVVTNHDYVLRSMLLVVSVGLVAYVLFGKKK